MRDVKGDPCSVVKYLTKTLHYNNHVLFMQYGFMPDRGTTDAIFALRQLMEKHRGKPKGLHGIYRHITKHTIEFLVKMSGDA